MKKIRVLVVDDEFYNRDLISKLVVRTNPDFEIIGMAEDIDEAFELIETLKPDLIFLDIKMPGGTGFDLLRKFENPLFEVVFITGFDEYALQAFEFNALDYILKPVDTSKLEKTLIKVQDRIINKLTIVDNLKEITELYHLNSNILAKIPLHHGDKVVLLAIKDILSIQVINGYTEFMDVNSVKYFSSKVLSSFEFIIDKQPAFVKIHKSIYINSNYVKHYTKGLTCQITMSNNTTFEVSRRKKAEILTLIDKKMSS